MTKAPSCARRNAILRPIPQLDPVTKAILPVNLLMLPSPCSNIVILHRELYQGILFEMLLSYSVSKGCFITVLFHFYSVTFHIRMLFNHMAT